MECDVKDSYYIVFLNRPHQWEEAQIFRSTGGHPFDWWPALYVFHYSTRLHSTKQARATKPSNVCKSSWDIVDFDLSFIEEMKEIFSSIVANEVEHSVRNVDDSIKNHICDTRSSEYLPLVIHMTFVTYVWLAKLCLKNNEPLNLSEWLNGNVPSRNILGIFHVKGSMLFSYQSHDVELKTEATKTFSRPQNEVHLRRRDISTTWAEECICSVRGRHLFFLADYEGEIGWPVWLFLVIQAAFVQVISIVYVQIYGKHCTEARTPKRQEVFPSRTPQPFNW